MLIERGLICGRENEKSLHYHQCYVYQEDEFDHYYSRVDGDYAELE
jgi:hypothetical protein